MLALVEIRRDAKGKQYLALQGQSEEEVKEMNRKNQEEIDRIAARIFNDAFWRSR